MRKNKFFSIGTDDQSPDGMRRSIFPNIVRIKIFFVFYIIMLQLIMDGEALPRHGIVATFVHMSLNSNV
jgi:hypothetical protein